MAIDESGRPRRTLRDRQWGLALVVLLAGVNAQAAPQHPHEVLVTPDALYPGAINEDGVVEANAARVENGVVYLEYRSTLDVRTASTAAAR